MPYVKIQGIVKLTNEQYTLLKNSSGTTLASMSDTIAKMDAYTQEFVTIEYLGENFSQDEAGNYV